jgi:hypothetical protein
VAANPPQGGGQPGIPPPPRRQAHRRSSAAVGPSRSNSSKLGAAGAGASGGTLLVLVANNLPPDHPLRPWLLGLAPTVAVALSWLAGWLKDLLDNWRDERDLATLIKQARETLEAATQDPIYSAEQREAFRKDLEALERIAADRRLARAKAISQRQAGN